MHYLRRSGPITEIASDNALLALLNQGQGIESSGFVEDLRWNSDGPFQWGMMDPSRTLGSHAEEPQTRRQRPETRSAKKSEQIVVRRYFMRPCKGQDEALNERVRDKKAELEDQFRVVRTRSDETKVDGGRPTRFDF